MNEKASMLKAISILKDNDREQGSKHFYFLSDPFLLYIMITNLTNKPTSQIFYENAFKNLAKINLCIGFRIKKELQLPKLG